MSAPLVDRDGFTINANKYGDFYISPFQEIGKHQELLSNLPKLKCYDDDVFLCGYGKSGTHWLWEICNKIMYGTVDTLAESKMKAMLEARLTKEIDSLPSPRLLNSHLPPAMLPVEMFQKKCKILFLVRDPRDVSVSLFHHFKFCRLEDYNGPWENFLEMFLDGKVPFGRILEYIQLWESFLQQNREIPLLVVHYEDLKQNIVDGIKRVSEFLEIPLEESLVQKIATNVDFQHLKQNEHLIYPEEMKKILFKDAQSSLFRKGIVGDWKNHFTDAQSVAFNARFQEQMKKSRFLSRYA
ncbi:hypothetical protein CHS0354_025439 [Potamilus streckersoni]|uniref:Sulfotransferase domain-containing protein n=1 Tax=Potamilus streckersoni TaxID=2493646 RepID=A0AAE0W0H2_9BIVA|nr:hypothetical protein CHS0354_025439 [Potamilus streckersoni]